MAPVIQGFLLGLANGGVCLSACAPVFLPYLVGEGNCIRLNVHPVLYFLCGRLAGYLGFAVFAWEAGRWIRSSQRGGLVLGAISAGLACLLVFYGFSPQPTTCAAKGIPGRFLSFARCRPVVLPTLMGLLTGLSLCPPFISAIAGATSQSSLASSLLFFAAFFTATSLYLVPFPFAGLLGRSAAIRTASRMAAGLMGCYLFYQSLIMIYGGLRS